MVKCTLIYCPIPPGFVTSVQWGIFLKVAQLGDSIWFPPVCRTCATPPPVAWSTAGAAKETSVTPATSCTLHNSCCWPSCSSSCNTWCSRRTYVTTPYWSLCHPAPPPVSVTPDTARASSITPGPCSTLHSCPTARPL